MTGLQKHVPGMEAMTKQEAVQKFMKSPEQGAATTVYAALSKDWEGRGGKYMEDCGEAELTTSTDPLSNGYAPHAYDEKGEKKLWADSLKFVGLKDDE